MSANDGGPAFPVAQELDRSGMPRCEGWNGMTLRDYFAAKAMQSLIGIGATLQIHRPDGVLTVPARDAVPNLAYEYADLMLRARAQRTSHEHE